MIKRFEWVVVGILAILVAAVAYLHIREHWPAKDYIESMARGQYDRARDYLEGQALEGNPQAQNSLANLYYLGLGGPVDFEEAASLYYTAAEQGYGAAQLNLGHLYKQGLGVQKNVERAFGWYMHANISNSVWAEYYMNQISVELTLTPLQMSTVKTRWQKLEDLASEPL